MKRKNKILIILLAAIFIWNANFSYAEDDDEFEREDEDRQSSAAVESSAPEVQSDNLTQGELISPINIKVPPANNSEIPNLSSDQFDNLALQPSYFDFYQPETPWAWYLSRATALVGFLLLYLPIFLGVSIRLPFLQKIIKPAYSVKIHGWISFQALFFAFIHSIALLFDRFISFDLVNIFIPFLNLPDSAVGSGIEPMYLNLGIIGFYLMLVLVLTSYLRNIVGRRFWRLIHFANIILYVFVVLHALALGTDMKNPLIRNIFIAANVFLAVLFIISIIYRIYLYAHLRQSDSQVVQTGNNQSFRRRI
jgi:predicted ferric reductase